MDEARGGGEPATALAPQGQDKGKRDEWSEGEVLCLLEAYESKWILRNRAKLKGSDWEDIARQVSARCAGAKALKTPNQCKNKIEAMKKRYRAQLAAANGTGAGSSWQFYARMDGLLKGAANCSARPKSDDGIDLQAAPKAEAGAEAEQRLLNSYQDNGSNTFTGKANADNNNNTVNDGNNEKRDARGTDSDVSAPRSKVADAGEGIERGGGDPCKRRRQSGTEVVQSIRLLADSILKIEQARVEMYKDLERMRAESEVKRGEMELKRTEIMARTQLRIAKLFVKNSRGRSSRSDGSSLRADLDMLPRKEGMGN